MSSPQILMDGLPRKRCRTASASVAISSTRTGVEIFCSANTSRRRATARAPLGHLPDLSTTMASASTADCGPTHAPSHSTNAATKLILKMFISADRLTSDLKQREPKSPLQKMLKEIVNNGVAFGVGRVLGAISHGHAVFDAKQIIDGDGVVEGFPAAWRIF